VAEQGSPAPPLVAGGSTVDPLLRRPIQFPFGLSFETVTAPWGGHFAHRPIAILWSGRAALGDRPRKGRLAGLTSQSLTHTIGQGVPVRATAN